MHGSLETVKYRVGGYKLPYMVCHVLLDDSGRSRMVT